METPIPKFLSPVPTFTATQLSAPYEIYHVESDIVYDSGNIAMAPSVAPLNSDGSQPEQSVVVVQVSIPVAQRAVTFNMARYGCECVAPDPAPRVDSDGNPVETLMAAEIKEGVPNPAEDANSARWTMNGRYEYVVLKPNVQAGESTLQGSSPTAVPSYGS